jgi:hypothetical protein
MLLVTFSDGTDGGRRRPGALRDGAVLDPSGAEARRELDRLVDDASALALALESATLTLDSVTLHAPLRPGKVIGPGEPLLHDGNLTSQLDRECGLAVVIGRAARR